MTEILKPIENAPAGIAALWVFSAGVSALAQPDSESSSGYCWLFRFLHLLAANLDRAGLLKDGSPVTQNRL